MTQMLSLYLTCKSQTWLEWFIFPVTFYRHSIFLGVVTIILNSPLKGNDCRQFWSFTLSFYKKKNRRSILASTQFCSASIHVTVKSFLLSIHPGGMRVMLLYIYIVLLDWCLTWFFLKPKITKFTVSICQNHSTVWITQLQYERKKYQVKMCLVRFSSAKMCKVKWWNRAVAESCVCLSLSSATNYNILNSEWELDNKGKFLGLSGSHLAHLWNMLLPVL